MWGTGFGFGFEEPDFVDEIYKSNLLKIISLDSPITKNMWFDNGDNEYLGYYMFNGCSNLTMGVKFNLPQNEDITSVRSGFCEYMFYNCTNLTMNSIFQLPQGIISMGVGFCNYMFYNCTSITTGVQHFFGNLILNLINVGLRRKVFYLTFSNCSSITEEISPETIPQLTVVPTTTNRCFSGCPEDKIVNCPTNWK